MQPKADDGLEIRLPEPVKDGPRAILPTDILADHSAMPEPLKEALLALVSQIDSLRGEVGLLKSRLSEAQDLADRDSLTPLYNRRALVRELQRTIAHVERHGAAASLV